MHISIPDLHLPRRHLHAAQLKTCMTTTPRPHQHDKPQISPPQLRFSPHSSLPLRPFPQPSPHQYRPSEPPQKDNVRPPRHPRIDAPHAGPQPCRLPPLPRRRTHRHLLPPAARPPRRPQHAHNLQLLPPRRLRSFRRTTPRLRRVQGDRVLRRRVPARALEGGAQGRVQDVCAGAGQRGAGLAADADEGGGAGAVAAQGGG